MTERTQRMALASRARPARATRPQLPMILVPPAAVTAILYWTRLNDVTQAEAALAFILLLLPWWSYRRWKTAGRTAVPLLACVTFVYWLFFAAPLFWGGRDRAGFGPTTYLPETMIQQALMMAVFGVLFLALGAHLGIGRRFHLPFSADLRDTPRAVHYVRAVLLAGTIFGLTSNLASTADSGTQQIVVLLQSSIPLLAYIILVRRLLQGVGNRVDLALVLAYFASTAVSGLASGWLGTLLNVSVASIIVYVWERRRLPLVPIVISLIYVLFFQAGKEAFRAQYWTGVGVPSNTLTKVEAWATLAFDNWNTALTHPTSGQALDLTRLTINRSSLLQQSAHVMEMTPAVVPYQNGSTYGYLIAGLIPRFVWPNKPSMNDANQFYQLNYGLTSAQNLNGVSIAVGSLTEAYINFSWAGIAIIMLLLGILFDFVESAFLGKSSGPFLGALGILIMLHFIVIESQLAVYLSGILQTALLAAIVFLPAVQFGWRTSKVT